MENSAKWIIAGMVFILAIAFAIYFFSGVLTGQAISENEHTYTKAICNETAKENIYCYDYEITCRGTEVITARIIDGYGSPHEKGWQDPRGEDGSIIACEQ